MANFDFEIPINFKDLQETGGSSSQYVVNSLVPAAQLQTKVDQFRVALSRNGAAVIVDHFDTFYSILEGWSRAAPELITDAWTQINKALVKLTQALPEVIDGGGIHQQNNLRVHQNALKMTSFVVCQLADKLENKSTIPSMAAAAKSKKAAKKQQQDDWPFHFDWEVEKQKLVVAFSQLLQLNLHRLWDPPVVEDSFLNMISTICFKFFENTNVNRQKGIQTEVASLVSICLIRYNQMSSICCRIMQVLAHYESATAPLTQLIVTLVESHDLQSIVPAIVREICRIDPEDLIRDATGSKAYAKIMQDLAKRIPDSFISSIPILTPLLDLSDPYVMRAGVLGVIGEIYVQRLTKMNNADKKIVDMRDKFADILEQHIHDVNGIVRSRVFQIWIHASENSAIMISRFHNLLDLAIGQVMDKTMLVRKYAVELIVSMLRNNPFNSQFEANVLEEKFKAEEEKLEQMKEEARKKSETEEEEKEDDEEEWKKMEERIAEALDEEREEEGGNEKQNQETNGEVCVKEGESLESVLLRICEFIGGKKLKEAIGLFKAACASFPDHPVLNPEAVVANPQPNFDASDSEMDTENEEDKNDDANLPLSLRDKTLRGLKSLFVAHRMGAEEIRKLASQGAQGGGEEMDMSESDIAVKKQEILVLYLKDSYNFTLLLQRCIPTVCGLLGSPSSTDVTQAVSFFVNAHNFGIRQAIVGIRKMLALIWSSDATIKEAVTSAYRDLYLSPTGNPRQKAIAISKNLIQLADGATRKETMCLERVVKEWIKSKEIDDNVIKVLWECFTGKLPDAKPTDAKWAVRLLTMVGSENVGILKANVDILVQVGFDADLEDLEVAVFTAEAIAKLPTTTTPSSSSSGGKTSGKSTTVVPSSSGEKIPSKYPNDDKIFEAMTELLVSRFPNESTAYWVPLMERVTFAIYSLAENPDLICGELLQRIASKAREVCAPEVAGIVASTPRKIPENASPVENAEEGAGDLNESVMSTIPSQTSSSKIQIPVCVLKRLVSLAGHVALRQLDHLDRQVAKELKRIRSLQEDKENKSNDKKEKKKKSEEEAAEEEMGLQGASADDQEAEFIARLCEKEVVSPPNLLSCFFKFIIYVCQNPNTFNDETLQTTAITALAKYMIVSQTLCQDNLQLLFTILERSSYEMVRSNAIIVLTDMAARFPNLIEPWTPHLYARLRDDSILVRRNTVAVLTHLILHDMVKVKGQISEMAVCLVDDHQTIADSATYFFSELANKGNAIYNILPDIISRLSDPEKGVGAEVFREIMKKIMKYISKDRQKEQVVEKLCQRFRSCKTDQQWRDLAFCISQLSFTDKMIQKLQENFSSFGDKMADEEIYDSFQLIVSNTKKFSKQTTKALLEEFEAAIDKAHSKGVGAEDNEGGGEVEGEANGAATQAAKKPRPKSTKGPQKTKKKKKQAWESDSDDPDDDDDDGKADEGESEEEQDENVAAKKKTEKPAKKASAPAASKSRTKAPVLDSDSEDDFEQEHASKVAASRPGRSAPPPAESSDDSDDDDAAAAAESSRPRRPRGGKGSVCAAKAKSNASSSRSKRR